MLKNYFKITLRNLYRRLSYTIINVLGLAIGISCCLLITMYVLDELSFDQFHTNSENIYRVNVTYSAGGQSESGCMTPTALLPTLKDEFAEVEAGTRVFDISIFNPMILSKGDESFQEYGFLYADSTFFDVFSFEVLKGNMDKALVEPNSIMLTESMVSKYFGEKEALGESIKVGGTDYKVTGVLADIPHNSHLQFDFVASFSSLSVSKKLMWGSANYLTFVTLNPNSKIKKLQNDVENKIKQILGQDVLGEVRLAFTFFPLTGIHLRSPLSREIQAQGDIKYIYIIGVIGLLILIIACINYMNLATARSMDRAREVGMRKVLGALKTQLFYQFMGESIMVTILSAITALLFVNLSLVPFNLLTGKNLLLADVFSLPIVVGLISIIVVVSFCAGAYPAISISSFQPGEVLKGSFKRSSTGQLLRKVLVIVQFCVSIFLIIGTLVIYKQLNFMRDKKLGYSKENVMVIPISREVNKSYATLKNELMQNEEVVDVSIASESPVEINGGYSFDINGINAPDNSVNAITVGQDFLSAMDMEIVYGRNFTKTDYTLATLDSVQLRSFGFIVNEQLLKQNLTSPENAIGMKANLNGRQGEIIGVVKDFHFRSLHNSIKPLVMFIEPSQYHKMFIRIESNSISETVADIEKTWKSINPENPFVFNFMDDEYNTLYKSEENLGSIFIVFASLAIFIGCLGLLGLVSFSVQQRNKEIGVRKVLGASVASILILISRDFTKTVLISFIISAPLSYYLMTEWLSSFEYKTTVGVLPLILAISFTMVVALLTISYQSIGSARMNPVDTLRSE